MRAAATTPVEPVRDFFDRARARLTLDVPPALTDPQAPARAAISISIRRCGGAPASRHRPAAVLVPVVDRTEPTVLLTLRTAELASHAGQIAFPGGKIDPGDESPLAAALREAKEEIGLDARAGRAARLSRSLSDFSGFRIVPTVARVSPDFTLTLNPREVAETFEVPLGFLMGPDNHQRHARDWKGIDAALLRHAVRRALHLGRHRGYPAQPATNGSTANDPADPHRDRAVPGAVRALRRVPVGDARRHRASGFVAAAALAGLVIAALVLMVGSFMLLAKYHRRAAGLDLCAGAYRERQVRAGAEPVSAGRDLPHLRDAPWLTRARCRACSRCSIATARRRAWSAARCATPACGSRSARSTSRPRRCRTKWCAASRPPASRRCRPASSTAPSPSSSTGTPFEVTTLRQDVETYGRKAKVVFGRDWKADAERRDFTINALSATRDGTVYDYVGGLADIAARRVRFIGEPDSASPRIICASCASSASMPGTARATPDPAGLHACIAGRDGLEQLSRERVRMELLKLLVAPHATPTLVVMADAGLLRRVLGGVPLARGLREHGKAEAAIGARPIRCGGSARSAYDDRGGCRAAVAEAAPHQCRARAAGVDGGSLAADFASAGRSGGARAALPARAREIHRRGVAGLGTFAGDARTTTPGVRSSHCPRAGARRRFRSRPQTSSSAVWRPDRRSVRRSGPPKRRGSRRGFRAMRRRWTRLRPAR